METKIMITREVCGMKFFCKGKVAVGEIKIWAPFLRGKRNYCKIFAN